MPIPTIVEDVEAAVDFILERIGRHIVLGIPLGLGKPVALVNALYRRAAADPGIQLRILTALSLARPDAGHGLERAFLQPFLDRVYAGVPELDYVQAQRRGQLPANIVVEEFFLLTGSLLRNASAQQHYISSNYTHAARDVFARGCNVVAQSICRQQNVAQPRYSLSCNPDTGPELLRLLAESGRPHLVLGEVNQQLPYFAHEAEVEASMFDVILDHPRYSTPLFSTPKQPISDADYAIGLHASGLVKDGGTLQLGIGSLGDAIVQGLLLRQQHNAEYRRLLQTLTVLPEQQALRETLGGEAPFVQGLYGATEMFVDGFWHLLRGGILKRKVYDFWALQQLVDQSLCDPQQLEASLLDHFEALGVHALRAQDFAILQHHGVFGDDTRYERGHLLSREGLRIPANLADPEARTLIATHCLGRQLRHGIVLHGGFFLGPRAFYQALRELSDAERDAIGMCGVDKINQLDRNPRLYRLQRREARFINTTMMVTLSGAFVSDGLADGAVVSGVGGQYNFVAQAQQLRDGRSLLLLRAQRGEGATAASNIVFNYGHITIPRHLRDIAISEYGVAELRSRNDNEVAKALIGIADSRFQAALLEQARRAGKIEADWRIPEAQRHNTPETLATRLAPFKRKGLLPLLPLGSDFDAEEQALLPALGAMRRAAALTPKWQLLLQLAGFRASAVPATLKPYLQRLQLDAPKNLEARVARMLLLKALQGAADR